MSNVPKLRFREFSGKWEEKKLGDLTEIKSASRVLKNQWTEAGVPFFRTSDVVAEYKGLENTKAYISMELFEELSKKSGRVKKNDILVTGGGSIGIPYLIRTNEPLYFKDADLLWFKNTDSLSGLYLYAFFSTMIFRKYISNITHTGTISHYTIEQAKSTPINLPDIKEQEKIASFLTSIDTRIEQLTKKESLLQEYKKGVMNKIFNQEIRFKDDDGSEFPEWENKKIKEIFEYKNGASFENDVIENGLYNLITLNSIDIKGELKNEHKKINVNNNSLNKNDLIMVLSDVAHGNFLGLVAIIPEDNKYVLNQRMGALKPKTNDNIPFIRMYINHNQKYFKLHGQGSSQQNLSKGDIEKFLIKLPCLQEQTKIANFLSSINKKIELTTKELNSTKEFKKALLQQMFV